MKKIIPYIFSCTLALLQSCGGETPPEAAHESHPAAENSVEITHEQYETAGIQLGVPALKVLSGTIQVNGMLDVPPQNLVSISTAFGGYVKSTEMLQGMHVQKGQKVAVLEHPDFIQQQQDYLDYKSQLDYLKLEYERQQVLAGENVNARKTLQKTKSEYESMRARVNGIRARLEMMHLRISNLEQGNIQSTISLYAPISGYVTQVNTNIGQYASPTDVLFRIADTEHLHAELTVFEKDIPKLKIGQKVRFTLSNESQERTATVYLIGREISSDRTIHIHCHLDREDPQLLPGMYLKAFVETDNNRVSALPSEAIVEFEGNSYVFVAADHPEGDADNGHHFKFVPVHKGVVASGYTEIQGESLEMLQGKQVVLHGAYDLLSQLKNTEGEGHSH